MCRAFLEASPVNAPYSETWQRRTLNRLMVSEFGHVSVLGDGDSVAGMLLAAASESPIAPVLVSQEIALWIEPGRRGRGLQDLLSHYRKWAADLGVHYVGLSTFYNPRTTRIFDRLGFQPVETHFFAKG